MFSINPNKSTISSEKCENYYLNYLSINCSGDNVQSPNLLRDDVVKYVQTKKPTSYQIKKGLDHQNIKALIWGSLNIFVKYN